MIVGSASIAVTASGTRPMIATVCEGTRIAAAPRKSHSAAASTVNGASTFQNAYQMDGVSIVPFASSGS